MLIVMNLGTVCALQICDRDADVVCGVNQPLHHVQRLSNRIDMVHVGDQQVEPTT